MPQYRRFYVPGGTFFLTLVTYCRRPLFNQPENIDLLRTAIAKTKKEKPFTIIGAVILPDHLHFLWTLPADDSNYSVFI
jgi:putative transposase